MLVIRLQRVGKKHQASFRIVLQDSRWKPKGKSLELLGFYNPRTKEKQIQEERVKFWIERGAQPSATLHNIFVDLGILPGPKVKAGGSKKGKDAAKKESEAKPAEAVADFVSPKSDFVQPKAEEIAPIEEEEKAEEKEVEKETPEAVPS